MTAASRMTPGPNWRPGCGVPPAQPELQPECRALRRRATATRDSDRDPPAASHGAGQPE